MKTTIVRHRSAGCAARSRLPNAAAALVDAVGSIYEKSPWIVERAFAAGPFASLTALAAAMVAVVDAATEEEQLAWAMAQAALAGEVEPPDAAAYTALSSAISSELRSTPAATSAATASPPPVTPPAEESAHADDADDGCIVCMDAPKTHAFVPCGHVCACATCSEMVMASSSTCPYCRGPAQMAMRVYAT